MSARLMPALSDGRTFTSYLSAGQAEEALRRQFGIANENQYRQYLQHNSTKVAQTLRGLQVIARPPPARRV